MLTLEDVNVYYDQVHALKSVTVEVKQGELVALLGANGAGKSTILMTISGILRPRSGHVRYEGHDLTRSSPYDIIQFGIGHCPEGRHIFGNLTVQENMLMGAVQRKDRAGVQRDMEWVYSLFPVLGERVRQSGATLSGGEQQMLAIGRALMGGPRLLLLDEPSLGLAPVFVQRIFSAIAAINRAGTTILMV